MTHLSIFLLALAALALPLPAQETAPIPPEAVAVLYNSNQDASKDLALHYAKQRQIPEDNLIGLPLSEDDRISRETYTTTLREPLRRIVGICGFTMTLLQATSKAALPRACLRWRWRR